MQNVELDDRLDIVGSSQHATATTKRGMRLSVMRVVSPSLCVQGAKPGSDGLDRETVDRLTDKPTVHAYWQTERQAGRQTDIQEDKQTAGS